MYSCRISLRRRAATSEPIGRDPGAEARAPRGSKKSTSCGGARRAPPRPRPGTALRLDRDDLWIYRFPEGIDLQPFSCLQGFSKIRLYFQDRRATRRGVNSARAARPRRAVRELRRDSGHGRDARARPRTTLRPRIDPCARRSGAASSSILK
jgi:hypothetical protein